MFGTTRTTFMFLAAVLSTVPLSTAGDFPCEPSSCGPFNQDPWRDGSGGGYCWTCVTVVTPDESWEQCEYPIVAGKYRDRCRIQADGTCETYGGVCRAETG